MKKTLTALALIAVSSNAMAFGFGHHTETCPTVKELRNPATYTWEELMESPRYGDEFKTLVRKFDGQYEIKSEENEKLTLDRARKSLEEDFRSNGHHTILSKFFMDNVKAAETAKRVGVCTPIEGHFEGDYLITNDYEKIKTMTGGAREEWQEEYDDCVLSRLDKMSNNGAVQTLKRTCHRKSSRETGYKF